MVALIMLDSFVRAERKDLYEAYQQVKYEVFVVEEGWDALKDDSAKSDLREDPFDDRSSFVVARTEDGCPIGILRGIALNDGFPHSDLFGEHTTDARFKQYFRRLCTLNALAVLPLHRGKAYRFGVRNRTAPVWKLLMLSMIRYFEHQGHIGALVTASGLAATRLLCQLGFQVIDRPALTSLHSSLLINIGLVFRSPRHAKAERACGMGEGPRAKPDRRAAALSQYFKEREGEVLGTRSLKCLFDDQISQGDEREPSLK